MSYRITSLLLAVLVCALVLVAWREYEGWQLRHLVKNRDAALATWRVVKVAYDAGNSNAVEEADARESYFSRREAVEAAAAASWWRGAMTHRFKVQQ
jgi:hypothetical protein